MAFQPSEMTEATLRRMVDNFVKFNKKSPLPVSPKRSQLQEAVAATLGFPTYHAAITSMKTAKSVSERAPPTLHTASNKGKWAVSFGSPRVLPSSWRTDVSSDSSGGIAIVEDELFANSALLKGTERDRRDWIYGMVDANPDRAVFVVQGPMSLPIKNLRVDPVSARWQNNYGLNDICSADELLEVYVSILNILEPEDSENKKWKGKAISLLYSILSAMVHLRNCGGREFETTDISNKLSLHELPDFANDKRLPSLLSAPIKSYLKSLPKYRDDVLSFRLPKETFAHHEILETRINNLLNQSIDCFVDKVPLIARLVSRKRSQFSEGKDNKEKEDKHIRSLIDQWLRINPKGLLVLDVLPLDSALWDWITLRLPHWLDGGAAIWLGVQSESDIPQASGPLVSRLAYRLDVSRY